jgi:carboxypeptidase family protein
MSARLFAGGLLVCSIGAWAQSFTGRIAGSITDSSGGAVPSTAVAVSNEGTGAERRLISDSRGVYVVPELPVGYYTVRVAASGFNTVEHLHVKVDVGGETRADVALALQTIDQSVSANASAPVLQQDSSALT